MTTTTAPDHAAEYADADDNIRSLTTARGHLNEAIHALDSVCDAAQIRAHVCRQIDAVDEAIRVQTRRRDAAELARRELAAAERACVAAAL